MKNTALFVLVTACLLMVSCKHKHDHNHKHEHHGDEHHHHHHHGDANAHMNSNDFQDLVNRFESKERTEYQQPEKVLEVMKPIEGKRIMEIGSGTGYFSFRLVDAGATVIAADVDDRFQNYIKEKRDSLGISDDQLSLRKVPYDAPDLADGEVDQVLIVNTYHHIENRPEYFSKVKKGLKEGGSLYVVDFFKKDLPVGPPTEMKISKDKVKSELFEAGFDQINVLDDVLPYQFIIVAQ